MKFFVSIKIISLISRPIMSGIMEWSCSFTPSKDSFTHDEYPEVVNAWMWSGVMSFYILVKSLFLVSRPF